MIVNIHRHKYGELQIVQHSFAKPTMFLQASKIGMSHDILITWLILKRKMAFI